MRGWLPIIMVCLLPAAATAQVFVDSDGSSPAKEWRKQASTADFLKVYPKEALAAQRSGAATLQCGLTPQSYLDRCRLLNESPQGEGFGQAALSLAPLYQRRSNPAARSPLRASKVTLTFRFVCEGCPPIPTR